VNASAYYFYDCGSTPKPSSTSNTKLSNCIQSQKQSSLSIIPAFPRAIHWTHVGSGQIPRGTMGSMWAGRANSQTEQKYDKEKEVKTEKSEVSRNWSRKKLVCLYNTEVKRNNARVPIIMNTSRTQCVSVRAQKEDIGRGGDLRGLGDGPPNI